LNFLSLYKRRLLFFLKKKINIDIDLKANELSLNQLFIKYGSDKAVFLNKKNKYSGHGYTKYYLKNFKKLKNKKLKILEIGSYAGASAAAFTKYLPRAELFCLDINISNFKYSSKRINIFGLNANNEKDYRYFLKKLNISNKSKFFDVIIDDGSHKLGDISKSLKFYFKNLKSKGLYIIEDFKLPNYIKHLDDPNEQKIDKMINFVKKKIFFKSKILNNKFQNSFFKEISSVKKYHGSGKFSDIVFFKKI
tara:strand:- start:2500 stop:3249 length:750 start_codon:yes stop_codon:yes gene_type:complete